jgi:nitroreductase
MATTVKEENGRKPEFPVDKIFLKRWSPRAMSGEKMTKNEFMTLIEAAKWAPSAYNGQPWRFIYAMRETPEWDPIFRLMSEFNQQWTKNASVLIVVVSNTKFEHNGQPSITHSFDTGAAWENLALQGSLLGYAIHGMSGFDYDKARKILNIPEDYEVEAMIAVGKPGKKEDLPDGMREREIPSPRKNIKEIIFEGKFMK